MLQTIVNTKNEYSIAQTDDGGWMINGNPVKWDMKFLHNGLINILYNDQSFTAFIESVDRKTKEIKLNIGGQPCTVSIKEPIDQLLSSMGLDLKAMQKVEPIKAPMPGMILKILVEPGQQINKGDGLLVLEAMKMENILKATATATVKAIKIAEKTAVEKGTILIELE